MNDVILSLDKLEKIGVKGVEDDLRARNLDHETITKIISFLNEANGKDYRYFERFLNKLVQEGLQEIAELKSYLEALGVDEKSVFNPFLARGLNIYTGTIYEIFLSDGSISSAIGSGGRYDKIIGQFLENEKNIQQWGYPLDWMSFIPSCQKERRKRNPISTS